jgi:hypothetical protein
MADLLGLLVTGWARVLERAALDAESTRCRPLPRAPLLPAIIDAAMFAPIAVWNRRRIHLREHQAVEDLYDEFIRLGRLRDHLPAEVDVVQRVIQVHQLERLWEQSRSTLSQFRPEFAQRHQPDGREERENASRNVLPRDTGQVEQEALRQIRPRRAA